MVPSFDKHPRIDNGLLAKQDDLFAEISPHGRGYQLRYYRLDSNLNEVTSNVPRRSTGRSSSLEQSALQYFESLLDIETETQPSKSNSNAKAVDSTPKQTKLEFLTKNIVFRVLGSAVAGFLFTIWLQINGARIYNTASIYVSLEPLISFLYNIAIWVIGIAIAFVLIDYYVTRGKNISLFFRLLIETQRARRYRKISKKRK